MPSSKLALFLLSALSLLPLAAGSSETAIVVQDLIGGAAIAVTRAQESVKVGKGGKLRPDDKFTTQEKQSVRLVFPDGSQLWVGGASSVLVNSSGTEVQLAYVYHGKVRVQVPKSQASVKKVKFVVRSRGVVMGVRGTDFVVDADRTGKYQLHTLEGEVEAAASDEKLISGGVPVKSGTYISGKENQAIPAPTVFDVRSYEAQLYREQPAFATFQQTPLVVEVPSAPAVPAAPAAAPPPTSSTSGFREKINQINQQHNQAIEDKVGF